MTKLRPRLIGLSTMLAAAVALSLPGAAYAQEGGTLTVQPSTVQDGEDITVSGQCPSGGDVDTVSVFAGSGFEGGLLGDVSISDDGAVSGSVTIPEGSPAASGEISVPCPAGGTILTGALTIEGPEPQPIGDVPNGGVDSGLGGAAGTQTAVLALGGAGLVLATGGALLLMRRRVS